MHVMVNHGLDKERSTNNVFRKLFSENKIKEVSSKQVKMKATQLCLTLQLHELQPTSSSIHEILQARILKQVAIPFSQGIFPTQGSNPGFPHCRNIFLPSEPPGKPRNTGVGSLSLLQGIFQIQELNQGLLHYRQILYQLRYINLFFGIIWIVWMGSE